MTDDRETHRRPHLDSALRHAVLGWTAFLSVFLWTSLNRALWRPEIATWVGFGMEGRGPGRWTGAVAIAAAGVLALFYLEGRGRRRLLVHGVTVTLHASLTAYLVTATWLTPDAQFRGDTWGWSLPLPILSIPFIVFTVLALAWALRERRRPPFGAQTWTDVDLRSLLIALGLTPIIAALFGSGADVDARAKVATAPAVLQWLVLVSAVQSPRRLRRRPLAR